MKTTCVTDDVRESTSTAMTGVLNVANNAESIVAEMNRKVFIPKKQVAGDADKSAILELRSVRLN